MWIKNLKQTNYGDERKIDQRHWAIKCYLVKVRIINHTAHVTWLIAITPIITLWYCNLNISIEKFNEPISLIVSVFVEFIQYICTYHLNKI